jgi:hypothetical protein
MVDLSSLSYKSYCDDRVERIEKLSKENTSSPLNFSYDYNNENMRNSVEEIVSFYNEIKGKRVMTWDEICERLKNPTRYMQKTYMESGNTFQKIGNSSKYIVHEDYYFPDEIDNLENFANSYKINDFKFSYQERALRDFVKTIEVGIRDVGYIVTDLLSELGITFEEFTESKFFTTESLKDYLAETLDEELEYSDFKQHEIDCSKYGSENLMIFWAKNKN